MRRKIQYIEDEVIFIVNDWSVTSGLFKGFDATHITYCGRATSHTYLAKRKDVFRKESFALDVVKTRLENRLSSICARMSFARANEKQ